MLSEHDAEILAVVLDGNTKNKNYYMDNYTAIKTEIHNYSDGSGSLRLITYKKISYQRDGDGNSPPGAALTTFNMMRVFHSVVCMAAWIAVGLWQNSEKHRQRHRDKFNHLGAKYHYANKVGHT
jgi:hypothetical protein